MAELYSCESCFLSLTINPSPDYRSGSNYRRLGSEKRKLSLKSMATLNKFKPPLTQYSVAASPSRSPSTSPVFHLHRRRRRTLRMLFNRPDRCTSPVNQNVEDDDDNPPVDKSEQEVRVRRKLKDLFVSSPPLEENILDKRRGQQEGFPPAAGNSTGNINGTITRRSLRPISTTFRYRLLRRAWRPVLVSIPE